MRSAILVCTAVALLAGTAPAWSAGAPRPGEYVGSERCGECHPEKYAGWKETFHATVVQDARKDPSVILGDFTVPNLGFTLEDVDYTIGGHWDQRYMKKIGDDYYVLPKLWSVQSRKWRPYNVWSWRKKPYSRFCMGCHVTGYDPGTRDAAEHRIGCEACHGPGRAHAEAGGDGPIVNPAKLSEERREMICAACHVRGQDPTGKFYFPVGFRPGEDLGRYYVPMDKQPDETNVQAILRNFERWKRQRSDKSKVRCEVCGIYGAKKEQDQEKDGVLSFCFGCHDFRDRYPEHTHHPEGVKLVCFDCHVQQTKDLMNQDTKRDVHSYGYFLVHPDNCYDRRIERTCRRCHADRDEAWARRTVERWRRPLELDH